MHGKWQPFSPGFGHRNESLKMILDGAVQNRLFRLMPGVLMKVVFRGGLHFWGSAWVGANMASLGPCLES